MKNSNELIDIISKQWCTTQDLICISGLGKANALKLKKNIKVYLENKSYKFYNKTLPMSSVLDYLNIDIDYIIDLDNKLRKEDDK